MKAPLKLPERLVVAADFEGTPKEVRRAVMKLARKLRGTGVIIKLNSVLRLCGYKLISDVRKLGLQVFADLKLCDIPETLKKDGLLLAQFAPEMVTVMASAGCEAIRALVKAMPETEVLVVTLLTSLDSKEVEAMHGGLTISAVAGNLAEIGIKAGARGLICSGHEAEMLRKTHGDEITLNCPGIRPSWVEVKNDDQRRMMTPSEAIRAGATRIVVGRPITGVPDPLDAVKRFIAAIEEGLA